MNRIALSLLWIVVVSSVSSAPARAQMIDVRMELIYNDVNNGQSGGAFQITARSSGAAGIAGLVTYLEGVDFTLPSSPVLNSPQVYGWLNPIHTSGGDIPPLLDRGGGVTEIVLAQNAYLPSSSLIYSIGHGAGSPGDRGVDPFGNGFDNAALLVTGTFPTGNIPAFSTQPGFSASGNVWAIPGSNAVAEAAVNLSLISNLATTPGDYDHSGVVDPSDYNLWKSSFGSTTELAADGNGNGKVDAADYTVWRDNLSSGSASVTASTAVPEPGTAGLFLIFVSFISLLQRQYRSSGKRSQSYLLSLR